MEKYNVAVVGATGAVGQKIIQLLEESNFPIQSLKLLASARSAGRKTAFHGQNIIVEETDKNSFDGIDVAFFSAGGAITKEYAFFAKESGAVIIDNTSAYRMDDHTPLVVPEVNSDVLSTHNGLIANPNCSTIQMVVALNPIRRAYGLSRIIVSTYQAVSGAGLQALEKLDYQMDAMLQNNDQTPPSDSPKNEEKHSTIAGNAIPQIDLFGESGYTLEEWKMINETKKIMEMPELQVTATCVRIPVKYGHSESVYFEVEKRNISAKEIQKLLKEAEGIIIQDDPENETYPTALETAGEKAVFVGRIRKDLDHPRGFHMWIVSDNLIKGAAWNSIQIAESLIKMNLLHKNSSI